MKIGHEKIQTKRYKIAAKLSGPHLEIRVMRTQQIRFTDVTCRSILRTNSIFIVNFL